MYDASNSRMTAVGKQVQRGPELYQGPSATAQASSPTERQVRSPSGMGVRDAPAPQAPARQREFTTETCRVSPARSTQLHSRVRDRSVGRSDQHRRYVNYGERNPTSDRCGSPRVEEGHRSSPSSLNVGDGRDYSFSLFEVCITLKLFLFCFGE